MSVDDKPETAEEWLKVGTDREAWAMYEAAEQFDLDRPFDPDDEDRDDDAMEFVNAAMRAENLVWLTEAIAQAEERGRLEGYASRDALYASDPEPTRERVRDALERCLAAQMQRDEYLNVLGELLAVIHRDGGHYQEEHGLEKACVDAVDAIVARHEEGRHEGAEAERARINRFLAESERRGYRITSLGPPPTRVALPKSHGCEAGCDTVCDPGQRFCSERCRLIDAGRLGDDDTPTTGGADGQG